jgi:hypothetical protein
MAELTPIQVKAIDSGQTSFLLGPAGSGKSTALQQRLVRLIRTGEPAYTMLVLVAEPEHRNPFVEAIHRSALGPFADLKVTTYVSLAQEMVSLFWPLVARPAGFERPYQPPSFLSYDLAQLLMYRFVGPMLAMGAFADLRLRPQQVTSQLLDTLNRAALNGLALEEAIERQTKTWVGEPERLRHLQDALRATTDFRGHCLRNSLLDLSLLVEVFDRQLVHHAEFYRYFSERYRHMIVDNVEEQAPAGQNFIHSLMPATQTTAIAYDAGGGHKRFMAADPLEATKFRRHCHHVYEFEQRFVSPVDMILLANQVENYLTGSNKPSTGAERMILCTIQGRYRREMIDRLVSHLADLVSAGKVATDEIAIITPYLDGALRYTLVKAMSRMGLPYRLLRRRTIPREEPRVRTWLSWLALANPTWDVHPSAYDVAEAMTLSVHGLDPARAALLVERLYQPDVPTLLPISELPAPITERVGQEQVELIEELRVWLEGHDSETPFDVFLHRLFTQLLSQPRFQPIPDPVGAAINDWLVGSATRVRQSANAMGIHTPAEAGVAFINGINQGLVTANPPDLGEPPDPNGVMISTIYGYLLAGRPVNVQVWLETAATGWWDIPNQPLSNAFVLAQSRASDEPWTADQDFAIRNELLSRIIRGLTSRCSGGIILATSDLDRRGQRQDGPLWRALLPFAR